MPITSTYNDFLFYFFFTKSCLSTTHIGNCNGTTVLEEFSIPLWQLTILPLVVPVPSAPLVWPFLQLHSKTDQWNERCIFQRPKMCFFLNQIISQICLGAQTNKELNQHSQRRWSLEQEGGNNWLGTKESNMNILNCLSCWETLNVEPHFFWVFYPIFQKILNFIFFEFCEFRSSTSKGKWLLLNAFSCRKPVLFPALCPANWN